VIGLVLFAALKTRGNGGLQAVTVNTLTASGQSRSFPFSTVNEGQSQNRTQTHTIGTVRSTGADSTGGAVSIGSLPVPASRANGDGNYGGNGHPSGKDGYTFDCEGEGEGERRRAPSSPPPLAVSPPNFASKSGGESIITPRARSSSRAQTPMGSISAKSAASALSATGSDEQNTRGYPFMYAPQPRYDSPGPGSGADSSMSAGSVGILRYPPTFQNGLQTQAKPSAAGSSDAYTLTPAQIQGLRARSTSPPSRGRQRGISQPQPATFDFGTMPRSMQGNGGFGSSSAGSTNASSLRTAKSAESLATLGTIKSSGSVRRSKKKENPRGSQSFWLD
jgi:hypothetical protein